MKKLILLFSLILLVAVSCKNELTDRPTGIYVEKSPIANRTTINFTSESKLTITFVDGVQRDFSFSVGEDMMTLTPLNVSTYPAKNVSYHYTDTNKFEIGSIYDNAFPGEVLIFERPAPKK